MAGITEIVAGRRWTYWRIAMWGSAAALLSAPAAAMLLGAPGVDWSVADFIVMGVMLATACGACELAARASANGAYRMASAIAIGTAFLTVWANLAVGMIGSEDNRFNLLFGGVLGIALVGAMAARFRPKGMSVAMLAAALAQLTISVAGVADDMRGGIFSALFSLPWLLSGALFKAAAGDGHPPGAAA